MDDQIRELVRLAAMHGRVQEIHYKGKEGETLDIKMHGANDPPATLDLSGAVAGSGGQTRPPWTEPNDGDEAVDEPVSTEPRPADEAVAGDRDTLINAVRFAIDDNPNAKWTPICNAAGAKLTPPVKWRQMHNRLKAAGLGEQFFAAYREEARNRPVE